MLGNAEWRCWEEDNLKTLTFRGTQGPPWQHPCQDRFYDKAAFYIVGQLPFIWDHLHCEFTSLSSNFFAWLLLLL